jgi:hypothetical protein
MMSIICILDRGVLVYWIYVIHWYVSDIIFTTLEEPGSLPKQTFEGTTYLINFSRLHELLKRLI